MYQPNSLASRSTRALALVPALALVSMSGCHATAHTMAPYRDDPAASGELIARAASICVAHRGGKDLPHRIFTTDGCSVWPDSDWGHCCVEHDIAYWCGGTPDDRAASDEALGVCVDAAGGPGGMMAVGVRVGGIPWSPFPYRWAYGWEGIHGYDEPRKDPLGIDGHDEPRDPLGIDGHDEPRDPLGIDGHDEPRDPPPP